MATTNLTRRALVGATAGAVTAVSLGRGRSVLGAKQDFAGKSITVATIDGELSNGVEAQMAAFEAATGATIELVKVPGADFATKITADLASGVGAFDVIIEPFIFLLGHAAGGFFVPIDDYIAADETVAIDDFIPLLFDNFSRFDGKVWALPYKADAYVSFHRKDLFGDPAIVDAFAARNGGAALKVPETMEELVATARFFTKSFNPESPTEFGWSHMAAAGGSATWIWASRLAALGGGYLDDAYHPNFNNDAGRQAMEIAVQLNECCPESVGSYGWEEANTAFLTGKVAMMEQWPGLSKIAETEEGFWGRSEVIGKTGYSVPAGAMVNDSLVQSSVLGGWAAGISNFAKDPDLAYRTISYLTSSEAEVLKIPAGNDPCRRSTYAIPEVSASNPLYPTLMACLEQARITADVNAAPVGIELQTIMGTEFNRIWIGETTGEEALVQVEEQWNEILERANLLQ